MGMIASPERRPGRGSLHGNDLLTGKRHRSGQEKSGSREHGRKGFHERVTSAAAVDGVSSR